MTFPSWSLPAGVELPGGAVRIGRGDAAIQVLPVSGRWLAQLTGRLAAARGKLLARDAADLARSLGRAGARFLDPGDCLREEALAALPHTSGLSPEMCARVLDGMAADWTAPRLLELLDAEFGRPCALDGFVARRVGHVRAMGAPLTMQIVAGSVPGVGGTALLRAMLVKSPTLIKPGRGDIVLPVLLARAIREVDADLGSAVGVVYWPGDRDDLTDAAVGAAASVGGTVVAYGGDAAVTAVRDRCPVTTPFVAYHHRVSVAVVGRGALSAARIEATARDIAAAVACFDQRGCVSPRRVYCEEGGSVDPAQLAGYVARALATLESEVPGGSLEAEEASSLHQVRGTAEVMAAAGRRVEVHHGGEASWTVVFDPEDALRTECVGRTAHLIPVADVREVPARLEPLRGHVQTVGHVGCEGRLPGLACELAEAGVIRIAPLDEVAFPPPWWHHDGRGPLDALVERVDLPGAAGTS